MDLLKAPKWPFNSIHGARKVPVTFEKRKNIIMLPRARMSLLAVVAVLLAHAGGVVAQPAQIAPPVQPAPRDGSHDFDFLIGDWKAHVRRLPDRLVGSHEWVEYTGISRHKKILDSDANFEEFEVDNPTLHLHIKAQTLRLYNSKSHQWSIYLLDVNEGTLDLPPVVGQFVDGRGEFYNQQVWNGRAVLVRYLWINLSPHSSRMEQAFSADGAQTWETNWICELSR